MRKLLLLSTLLFTSFAQAQNKLSFSIKGNIDFVGEVTEETCVPNLSKNKHLSSQQIIKSLLDNCPIKNSPTDRPIPRVKVSSFTPALTTQNPKSTTAPTKYSFFISEYI